MLSARLIQAALFATALTYADTQPADWGFAKQRAKAASFLAGRFDQELGLLKGVRHFTYYYFLKRPLSFGASSGDAMSLRVPGFIQLLLS